MRRVKAALADNGPVVILAVIAAVGSFDHISHLAARYGQTGWRSWAVAVCIDLMCVMAARERQRDKRLGRRPRGPVSGPRWCSPAASRSPWRPTSPKPTQARGAGSWPEPPPGRS